MTQKQECKRTKINVFLIKKLFVYLKSYQLLAVGFKWRHQRFKPDCIYFHGSIWM